MKTLLFLVSLNAAIYGAYAVVEPILPNRSRANTCASICNCSYGPCDYEDPGSQELIKSCVMNGVSMDCCNYCSY